MKFVLIEKLLSDHYKNPAQHFSLVQKRYHYLIRK